MANKNTKPSLISENMAKRWMKLAKIENLTENRFGKVEEEASLQEEMPPSVEDEQPSAMPTPPAQEPDGDEGQGVSEPMIQDLVKAIADAISAQTGVAVDVQGAGGSPEMPPEEEKPGQDLPAPEGAEGGMTERKGHRDHSAPYYVNGEPMKEETSPAVETETPLKEEFSQAPKKTMPNQAGHGDHPKDNTKTVVRVDGVEKADAYLGRTNNSYPHKLKDAEAAKVNQLEEQLYKKVLARLLEDVKKSKNLVKETKTPK